MSDTETKESQDSASSPPEPTADEQNKAEQPPIKRQRSGRLGRLFLLIVLFALLAVGYWFYLHPRLVIFAEQFRELESGLVSAQVELLGAQDAVSMIRQQFDRQQEALSGYESALAATQNELAAMAERLRDVESSRSGDWVVAEAQYLVRLANQKLLIGTDIGSAVELLDDADELLFELGYPEARSARQALASDILRLEQVRQVDYQGIYFRLSGLVSLVSDLPMPEIQSLEDDIGADEVVSDQPGWKRWWQSFVSRLEPFFIIRRDSDAETMLSSEQLELQKLRVQILLHEAQLGLMSTEQEIYRDSLESAMTLVGEFFGESDQAERLIDQIEALASMNVQIEIPQITASLRALQDLGDYLRTNPPGSNPANN